MANPLGARKDSAFKAVSTAPSINYTPIGKSRPPLPYSTVADLSNSVAVVGTVRFNGQPAYVLNQSTQPSCRGDDAGSAKGVRSGTVNGEVRPTAASTTVRAGRRPVVRVGDACTMNGGNNPGVYTAAAAPQATPPAQAGQDKPKAESQTREEAGFFDRARQSVLQPAQGYKAHVSEALHEFAGKAMDAGGAMATAGGTTAMVGGGMVATGIGAAPGAVIATAGGATAAVGRGVATVGAVVETMATGLDAAAEVVTAGQAPDLVALGTAFAQRMVTSRLEKLTRVIPGRRSGARGDKSPSQAKRNDGSAEPPRQSPPQGGQGPGGGGDGFTVLGSGGDCGIKAFKDQKCAAGQQRHHIVPDYALRYGSRAKGAKGQERIPGMPAYEDGPSICLSGQARSGGSEHNAVHEGVDPRISAAGKRNDNGAEGLAPIGEIIDISVEEAAKAKPHCADEIKRKTDEAFKDVDRKKYGRTTQQPPAKGSDAQAALERGERHQRGRFKR